MNKQGKITKQHIPQLLHYHLPQYSQQLLELKKTFGMTNQTYVVYQEGKQPVMFRILSPIIDRKYQNQVLKCLDTCQVTAKTYFACQKYRIQEFISNSYSPSSDQLITNIPLLKRVLSKLHRLHQIKLPKQIQKSFFDEVVFTQAKLKKYQKLSSKQQQKEIQFQKLKKIMLSQFDKVKQRIKNFKKNRLELSFSHNDLNNNNILIRNRNGQQQIFLIDFQYSCYNYVSYDIANLLNQCCFKYIQTTPGFKIIKKVNDEQILQACNLYPGKYEGIQNDIKFMLMVCNYFWGLWSLEISRTAKNFSPVEHGKVRYSLYKFYSQKIFQE